MKTAVSPRKAPRQARSQATVEAILDAAARVLIERGYAAANTNLVAERAGVSVGSLYQYFPNKDALITALHDRHSRQMDEVMDRAFAASEHLPFDAALQHIIEGVVEAHRVEAGLHRVLETQLAGLDMLSSHEETEARIAEQMGRLLERYPDQVRVPNLRLAVYMLMHALHALVHAVVATRPSGVSLKTATHEIVRMTRLYLSSPPTTG
ncbi:MAG TPA: TetR/AcrR family transcriptional regulator [Ideonella sp.]|nr:TetR/AcrR family transcriptional regulator [Ideonella sp.]